MERNEKPIVYVDTHIVTRMASGKFNDLSEKAMELLNHGRLFYSPMVGLELHYLYERNRLSCTPADMLSYLAKEANLQVSDVSFAQIALKAREVHWTRDPFDCLITAEAMLVEGAYLITRDREILTHFERAVG
jgi:PIN domain nuclease of toxin-antitoxin system